MKNGFAPLAPKVPAIISVGLIGLTAMLGSEFWPVSPLSLIGIMSTTPKTTGKSDVVDMDHFTFRCHAAMAWPFQSFIVNFHFSRAM
jgi:hypothetical protein